MDTPQGQQQQVPAPDGDGQRPEWTAWSGLEQFSSVPFVRYPLVCAAQFGRVDVVEILLSKGYDKGCCTHTESRHISHGSPRRLREGGKGSSRCRCGRQPPKPRTLVGCRRGCWARARRRG